MQRSVHVLNKKRTSTSVKEERQRTGRYIAILVGISLFVLAIYHAWVRRIPIVASLVVPALIMFVYVGWVLYSASRDKHKLLDAEAALRAEQDRDNEHSTDSAQNNTETFVKYSKETSKTTSPEDQTWSEISSALVKGETRNDCNFVKPVILVNDKPPEDLDEKWTRLIESVANNDKFKVYQTRRKFKRKFCRSKRHAAFKRSYTIA